MDAVVPQHGRLPRTNAVQGLDGQRPEPAGNVLGGDRQDPTRQRDLTGGGRGDRDGRADADVDAEAADRPDPQEPTAPALVVRILPTQPQPPVA